MRIKKECSKLFKVACQAQSFEGHIWMLYTHCTFTKMLKSFFSAGPREQHSSIRNAKPL